jgi:hypothetical protein
MSLDQEPPIRLVELPPKDDPRKLGAFFRSAIQAPEETTPLLKWRIRSTLREKSRWSRRALRVALVGSMLFMTGGVVGAVVRPLIGGWMQMMSSPSSDLPPPTPIRPRKHTNIRASQASPAAQQQNEEASPLTPQAPVPQPVTPDPAPAEPVPASAHPASVPPLAPLHSASPKVHLAMSASAPTATKASNRATAQGGTDRTLAYLPTPAQPVTPASERRPMPAPVAVPPSIDPPIDPPTYQPNQPIAPPAPSPQVQPPAPQPPTPSPILQEQALLTKAIRNLRTLHDGTTALAALDEHARRFPSSSLGPEASMLRAEALLLLERKNSALVELDKLSLDGMPNSEDRHVVRGELRAAAGRWRAAHADFQAVLAQSGEAANKDARARERFERALWGRASARSHLADEAGARADLREYLVRFPQGRFAVEAARLLGQQR